MCTFRSISAWLAVAAVVCGAVFAKAADNPRAAFKAANRHFADADYAAASEAYLQAAELAADPDNADYHLDPAVPAYNAGLAAFAAGDASAVTNLFASPAPTGADDDLKRQSQIAYNQGCLLYQQAQTAMQQPEMGMMPTAQQPTNAPAPTDMAGAAVEAFKKSVLLDPDNLAAKQNYELSLALRQQAMEQQQQQQQNDQNQNDQEQDQDQQNQDQQSQEGQEQDQDQQPSQDQQQDGQDQQQQQDAQQGDQDDTDDQQAQEPDNGEEMTPEEAQMLMDALSDQEQSQRDRLHLMLGRPVPVEKDW